MDGCEPPTGIMVLVMIRSGVPIIHRGYRVRFLGLDSFQVHYGCHATFLTENQLSKFSLV